MSDWRRSPAIAALVVLMVLTLQLVIPITRLGKTEGDQRFGWQMFSVARPPVSFTVETPAGLVPVVLEDVVAVARADLPLIRLLPPFLCESTPASIAVIWETGRYEC